jgi:hypothetical protein
MQQGRVAGQVRHLVGERGVVRVEERVMRYFSSFLAPGETLARPMERKSKQKRGDKSFDRGRSSLYH